MLLTGDIECVEEQVNDFGELEEGEDMKWELYGSPFVFEEKICQAMVGKPRINEELKASKDNFALISREELLKISKERCDFKA